MLSGGSPLCVLVDVETRTVSGHVVHCAYEDVWTLVDSSGGPWVAWVDSDAVSVLGVSFGWWPDSGESRTDFAAGGCA